MAGYVACDKFDQYVELIQVFAGERDLLREIIDHRTTCQTCRDNNIIFLDWSRVRMMNAENQTSKIKGINQLANHIKDWPTEYKRMAGETIRDAVNDMMRFQANWKQIIMDANQAIEAIEEEMNEDKIDDNQNMPEM